MSSPKVFTEQRGSHLNYAYLGVVRNAPEKFKCL